MAELLGINLSPFVRKALLYIFEADIDIEHRDDVLPMPATDELKAVNPRGKIPAYKDDDISLGESAVICAYLERKHGDSGLYPKEAADYGKALWFEKYSEEELIKVIGPVFFNRVVAPMMGGECDDEAVAGALAEQPARFAYLNEQVTGRQFLVGNTFSIADISIVSPFINQRLAGEGVDAKAYPELSRYVNDIMQRPAFTKAAEMAGLTS